MQIFISKRQTGTLFYILLIFISACNRKVRKKADSIYFHGHIVTMDDSIPEATALALKDGKVIAVGNDDILNEYECEKANIVDLGDQFVFPGLIDAHCHFFGYANTLMSCNLVGTKSWQDVVQLLDSFSRTHTSPWLTGRGWDQNDWPDKKYPDKERLDQLFPDRPVILKRIDGHAAICNQKALSLAGIDVSTAVTGGEIIKLDGKLTGVLVDNAVDLVERVVTQPQRQDVIIALKQAEKECYGLGLTTLADAGLDVEKCLFLDSLGKEKVLGIYLYMMLNPTEDGLKFAREKGEYENDHTKICSFKLYADGALGSRGARLKRPYCDRKDHSGMLLNDVTYFDKWCSDIKNTTSYQVNTHCIGDSANRLLLEVYGKYLKAGNDERWRIEHAQIIDMKDIGMFGRYNIIPSVQPTHATSDGPWVEDRLCNERIKGAYAYKSLLNTNGYLPLGTDFPVEYLNPIFTFYSAVFRENANVPSQTGFLVEEGLTPAQALKGMTIWAAKACRLEHRKGSIAVGKDADFIVLDKNILIASKSEVLKTKVLKTVRNGVVVH